MKRIMKALILASALLHLVSPTRSWAQANYGRVEVFCSNYNTSDDSVTGTAEISRAYSSCYGNRKFYHAAVLIPAPSGWNYALELWFGREGRDLSVISSASVYKYDAASNSISVVSEMGELACSKSVLIRDRAEFLMSSITATPDGLVYPQSFGCSIKIVPNRI